MRIIFRHEVNFVVRAVLDDIVQPLDVWVLELPEIGHLVLETSNRGACCRLLQQALFHASNCKGFSNLGVRVFVDLGERPFADLLDQSVLVSTEIVQAMPSGVLDLVLGDFRTFGQNAHPALLSESVRDEFLGLDVSDFQIINRLFVQHLVSRACLYSSLTQILVADEFGA